MIYKQPPSWLAHHGIEGQRWGVRHGPPYPIQDKILRKGTKLNSLSIVKNTKKYKDSGRMVYTYNANDPHDKEIYRGAFVTYLWKYRSPKYYGFSTKYTGEFDHEFETLRDLKMPTSKERLDEFVNLYNNSSEHTKKRFTDELNNTFRNISYSSPLELKSMTKGYNLHNKNQTNLSTKDNSAQAAYAVFNNMMEYSHSYEITRQYVKNMKQKYDAMIDDYNQKLYNDAHDPIIIFDPKNDLVAKTKKGREISDEERRENYAKVSARQNGRVLL